MGTNYSAYFTPATGVTVELHIGKSSGGVGLHTVSGIVFPDVSTWRSFLTHNNGLNVTIKDEYDREYDAEEFIQEFLTTPDVKSEAWLREQGYTIQGTSPVRPHAKSGVYWVDKEGFLFYDGYFS